jgi:hypothetical protein
MNARPTTGARPVSIAWIAISIVLAVTCCLVLDRAVLMEATSFDAPPLALLLNAIAILQVGVGAVIEWRGPGHAIGRLLMLSGPLFAFLALGWTVASVLEEDVNPMLYALLDWGVTVLSYPGMAVIAGWLPLLFPTGTLPGPRWRLPVGMLIVVSGVSLLAVATRPGPLHEGGPENPFGLQPWPPFLQALEESLLLQLVVLSGLAVAGLAVRYRRGDPIERHQIRWLLASVAVVAAGFAGVTIESAIRVDDGISFAIVVAFVGFLLMPIAIGIAGPPLPAVRDRQDHQPHDRLGGGDRDPGRGVRGGSDRPPGAARSGDQQQHARGSRLDPARRSAVRPGPRPCPAGRGQAVRPGSVRRGAAARRVRRATARRGGSLGHQLRRPPGCRGHGPAHEQRTLAAYRFDPCPARRFVTMSERLPTRMSP